MGFSPHAEVPSAPQLPQQLSPLTPTPDPSIRRLRLSTNNYYDSREQISQVVVNAQQMRDIEGRVFAAGMPSQL